MNLGYGKRVIAHREAIQRTCDFVLNALREVDVQKPAKGAEPFGMINTALPDESHWIYRPDPHHADQIAIADWEHMHQVHEDIATVLSRKEAAAYEQAARHIGELRQMSWLCELVARDETYEGRHSLDIDPLSLRLAAIVADAFSNTSPGAPSVWMVLDFLDVRRALNYSTQQQLELVTAFISDLLRSEHAIYEKNAVLQAEAVGSRSDLQGLMRIAIEIDGGTINATATLSGPVLEVSPVAVRLSRQPAIYTVVGSSFLPLEGLFDHPLTNGLGLLSIGGSSMFEAQAGRYLLKHDASLHDRHVIAV